MLDGRSMEGRGVTAPPPLTVRPAAAIVATDGGGLEGGGGGGGGGEGAEKLPLFTAAVIKL